MVFWRIGWDTDLSVEHRHLYNDRMNYVWPKRRRGGLKKTQKLIYFFHFATFEKREYDTLGHFSRLVIYVYRSLSLLSYFFNLILLRRENMIHWVISVV